QGAAEIGNNGLVFTNQGTVNANDASGHTLLIDNGMTNQSLIEATGTGLLQMTTTVLNTGANIKAIGSAATVEFTGAHIEGGTLTTNSGGTIETYASNSATLDGTATYGQLTIVGTYPAADASTTVLLGTINNTGTILLN